MKYAVVLNGSFTGVAYDQLNDHIVAHHTNQNETFVKVHGLKNTGTEETPVWEEVSAENSPVPNIVSMRQARIVLNRHGYLSQVSGAILNLSEPQKTEASIEWEYATTVERDSALVILLQSELSITDDEIDQMFREAVLI